MKNISSYTTGTFNNMWNNIVHDYNNSIVAKLKKNTITAIRNNIGNLRYEIRRNIIKSI